MKLSLWVSFIFLFLAQGPAILWADDATGAAKDGSTVTEATPTPVGQSTPEIKKTARSGNNSKVLVIHKPMPSPSWGRVIQYRRQEVYPLSENNRETLYEFLFQDEEGVIRTAVFHENASGDGYWEVTVWDQPQ